jgi:hypothetical protein
MKKILLFVLSFWILAPVNMDAQMKVKQKKHYVKMKPKAPKYTKVVAPSADYVYIKEDWTWNPATNTWEWYGNRWVQAPAAEQKWIPGHWRKTSYGWVWQEGYWK